MCRSPARPHRAQRARPGFVSRCRTTSAEWQSMSLSTPPPCSLPVPEPWRMGPAVLLRRPRRDTARPVVAAPRAQSSLLPGLDCGAKRWFSRYPCAIPACSSPSAPRATPRPRFGPTASRTQSRERLLHAQPRPRRWLRRSRSARRSGRTARSRRSPHRPPCPRSTRMRGRAPRRASARARPPPRHGARADCRCPGSPRREPRGRRADESAR